MVITLSKLTRPDVREAHHRERLFARLDSACKKPVIWISAPAGAGKTTLISSYIESRDVNDLWYQVDEGDADIASFFHFYGQAVKQATHTRKKMPILGPEYQQGIPGFTRNYFREIFRRFKSPALLVLDNFQEAGQDSELQHLLAEIVQEIPAGSNIVIISRTDPPESFAQLRSQQQLGQLNWADLQFTIDEELAVTQKRYPQRRISREQIQKLNAHLQGWVTGLILILEQEVKLDNVTFDVENNSREYLFDYFASELFCKVDIDLQDFLLKTSFLPRMSVVLCKKLSGNNRARKILSELVRKQYFTVCHGLLKVEYEYHPLFREFLQSRAEDSLSQEQYQKLQNDAGVLLAEAGNVDISVSLLIQAKNWDLLTELLLKHAKHQIDQGCNKKLVHWIEALPDATLDRQAWLIYWLGIGYLQTNHLLARTYFERSYSLFTESEDIKGLYLSWCGVADSYVIAHDSFDGAERWIKELAWLQKTCSKPLSLEVRGHLAFSATGLFIWVQPTDDELSMWIGKIKTMHRFIPNSAVTIMCTALLCIYYSFTGQVSSIRYLNKKLASINLSDRDSSFLSALTCVAVVTNDWVMAEFKIDREHIDYHHHKMKADGVMGLSGLLVAQGMYHAFLIRDLVWMEKLLLMYKQDIADDNLLDQGHYHLHLCNAEILREQFDRALDYNKTAIELIDKAMAPFPKWVAYTSLAYLYIEKEQFQQAYATLDSVQHIVKGTALFLGYHISEMTYSYLEIRQGNEAAAINRLRACFKLAVEKELKSAGIWPARMIATVCTFALEHNVEPAYAKNIIRLYNYTPDDSLYKSENWPWAVKIYCHRRFLILLNEQVVKLERRPAELLKLLLSLGGRDVREEKIMDILWPDAEGDQARTNFKITLHRLRQAFSGLDVLVLKNHQLSLNEQYVWVDTWLVGQLLAQVDECIHSENIQQSKEYATKLFKYYRTHFLDKELSSWVIHHREVIRLRFLRHCISLAQLIEKEDPLIAITCYQRILEIDPLIEVAYQGMIRCYLAQGCQAEAHNTYQQCVNILAASSGVLPSATTRKILEENGVLDSDL